MYETYQKYNNHGIWGFYTNIDKSGAFRRRGRDYLISVDAVKFKPNAPNSENIKIISDLSWFKAKAFDIFPEIVVEDLNTIDAKILNHFVFVDTGSLARFEPEESANDLAHTAVGQDFFNASNELDPLKVYKLKRTLSTTSSEKSNYEKFEKKVSRTYWDVDILDHSKDVPCSRRNHCIAVNNSKNCLYLIGGITILVDSKFKGCPDKMRNKQFWRKKQLCDVWKLCLTTNTWEKILDFRPETQPTTPKSITAPFLLFNLQAIYDQKRDLIYGFYQEHTLKNDTELIITSHVICIDPITKRFEDYSFPISEKATLFLDRWNTLYFCFPRNHTEVFQLIDKKMLNLETRWTMQLITLQKPWSMVH